MLYQKWTRYHRANCLWQEMLKWFEIIKEQEKTKKGKKWKEGLPLEVYDLFLKSGFCFNHWLIRKKNVAFISNNWTMKKIKSEC